VFLLILNVLEQFINHVKRKKLFSREDKLLLALSGGPDSIVLAWLLHKGHYDFDLAHCNFKLRGQESDGDEKFCRQFASSLKRKIYVSSFDTEHYAADRKVTIQVAARELRYSWFNHLLNEQGYDCLLTAHHASDQMETMLLNLVRGSGIQGLKGIPEKTGMVVRPLLIFGRTEIEHFAKMHHLEYRTDSSNLNDKYQRNFIRHHLTPVLKKLNPDVEATFVRSATHLRQQAEIVKEYLAERSKQLLVSQTNGYKINIAKLTAEPYCESILHELLSPLGFSATQEENILQVIHTHEEAGKKFFSNSHRLTLHAGQIIIEKLSDQWSQISIPSLHELQKLEFLSVQQADPSHLPSGNDLLISASRLIYPLLVRPRQQGDRFQPFGMKGFKLVSDFLREQRLNEFDRERCRLLVNGNGDVIWVAGLRSDERYRVKKTEKDLLKLSLREQ
jgi:tRNA(Ile)-lysidine synthase